MGIVTFTKRWIRRFSFHGLSIQQRLPLLICILLLCVIISFSWISYIGVKNVALQTGRERVRSLTGQLSLMLNQSAQTMISGTRAAADSISVKQFLRSGGREKQSEALEVLQKLRQDSTSVLVELLNPYWRPVLVSGKGSIGTRVNFDSLLAVFTRTDSSAALGKIYQVRDSMFYPLIVPVTDYNTVAGYIVRWRIVATTQRAVAQLSQLLGANASLYVGNNDGSLWTDMMRPVSNPIPGNAVAENEVLEYRHDAHGRMMASLRPIAGTPWIVMVEFSRDSVLQPANRFLQFMILIGGILLVITVMIAWLLSRNITRPLKKLTAATTAIANGNVSSPVYIDRKDEIGKLSRAFNAMVAQVNKARKELESKIIETGEVNEQLRNLSAHLQNVREQERIHIAREMHDELGQLLTGFKMDVAWLSKRLAEEYDPVIREKLEGMITIIDDAVKFVRRIAAELRPSILDDLGLIPALEWHSSEFERRYSIEVDFQSEIQELSTTSLIATGLFRMYQESLTNVARHSGAKKVITKLQIIAGTLCLSVTDDGKGFEASQAERKTLGLLGMRERAIMIGGRLEIKSEPGEGTTILISIPIPLMVSG